MPNTTYLYRDRPLFGMDIGSSSVKVMQISAIKGQSIVSGYGVANFAEQCITDGVLIRLEEIAASIHRMFNSQLVGTISTNRVAISVPAANTFSRILTLPSDIPAKDLPDAVATESQQYLPANSDELYTDYTILDKQANEYRILSVAVKKDVVDSYMALAQILGLEVVTMEPTTAASNRLFGFTDRYKVPAVLIDFGATSADVTIYDNNLVVTGTIHGGGDHYTTAIKDALDVSYKEAQTIKSRYGLNVSKKQSEINRALKPLTDDIVKEVRRMARYYGERVSDQKQQIGQIVLIGGGANIPGLSNILTDQLRIPVRSYDPWQVISFGSLTLPSAGDENIYTTSAGLSLIKPEELFR